MGSLKIIKAGTYLSVQDNGRKGFAFYSIPRSGCLDSKSFALANEILAKNPGSPALEIIQSSPEIIFNDSTQFVLCGADMSFKLNNNKIELNKLYVANPGDILKGGQSKDHQITYLSVQGDLNVKKHYNSASSYPPAQFGALNGQALQKGDVLKWKDYPHIYSNKDLTKSLEAINTIKIHKGPEYEYLSNASKNALSSELFSKTTESNRMGARLESIALTLKKNKLDYSVPVLPGFIQLPPSGQAIVLLQDSQTTGGYPRIAYIDKSSLSDFNQINILNTFRFVM